MKDVGSRRRKTKKEKDPESRGETREPALRGDLPRFSSLLSMKYGCSMADRLHLDQTRGSNRVILLSLYILHPHANVCVLGILASHVFRLHWPVHPLRTIL